MHDTIEIAERYCGPPGMGNGGYAAGLLAVHSAPSMPTRVRLLRPIPLAAALEVRTTGRDRAEVVHLGQTLATAEPGVLDLEPPRPPDFETATALSLSFAGFRRHAFPGCFVCGPNRTEGDGLRIFAGPRRPGEVAAAWRPHPALDRGDGATRAAHVWAALDCPGYFAAVGDGRQMLLGEMTALVGRPVRIGEPCVLLGWRLGVEGRRHRVGTALFGETGDLCALAQGVWIEPRSPVQVAPPSPGQVTASPDSRAPLDTSTMHT